ncbi:hypothetical protein GGS24DRAFT_92926 [Hypoxylon argillaceum]|nr:hypothetical protein GGS24DRAFT_92926 [Hypoxylon argillaceum]
MSRPHTYSAEIRGSWGLLGYLANLLACVILFTTYKGADFKTLFNTHTIIYVYLLVAFYSTMGLRGLELHRQCVCSNVDRFEPLVVENSYVRVATTLDARVKNHIISATSACSLAHPVS